MQTIYLIRHGEGWHNIGYDHNFDAHLTPRGWAQTAALQQHLAALQPQLDIEVGDNQRKTPSGFFSCHQDSRERTVSVSVH